MTQQCPSNTQITAYFVTPSAPCGFPSFTYGHSSAGTASGGLFALQCPDLQNYSHARAHKQPTLDAVAVGDGIVSVSADWIRFHNTGCVPKLTIPVVQVGNVHASLNGAHGSHAVAIPVVLARPLSRLPAAAVFKHVATMLVSIRILHTQHSPLSRACWRLMMLTS